MADEFRRHDRHPEDLTRQFKDLGTTDPQGRPVYAEVVALEPASIGGGGGGVASAVAIADGVSSAIKATVTGALALKVDGSAVTQPISAASLPLPTDAATETTLAAVNTKLGGTIAVSGTFWQATQPVSGTFWQATQPISAASLPLPTGAATDSVLQAVRDRLPASLGQKTMANSLAVVVSSDQSAIPVSGTFWQATQPVSAASLPLPTGAATEATLANLLTLAGFQARINTLGQKAMSASTPVVLSSDQSAIPVTGTFWQATQPISGTVTIQDGGNVITVDALNLDIRDLVFATDKVDITGSTVGLVAGTANIGDVDVLTLPPLVAGTANIGDVDVLTLPALVAGTANIGDVDVLTLPAIPAGTNDIGKVRLYDGADEATILPVRTQPATTEKMLLVAELPIRTATYATTIATQTPAITIGVKELLALWYTGGTKDIYIVEIWATGIVTTASTAGRTTVRLSTITTAPTGGVATGVADVSGAGGTAITNSMQVKTGGGTIGTTFVRKIAWWATQTVGQKEISLFTASNVGNGIILRGGGSAGISIDIEREVAHTALVDLWTVGVRWLEL